MNYSTHPGLCNLDNAHTLAAIDRDARPLPVCQPSRRCQDDSCDGAHCRVCGGHFLDFYHGGPVCTFCQLDLDQPSP